MISKNNMDKVSTLLIALTSAVFLVACGAGSTDSKDSATTAASNTATSEAPTSETPSAASTTGTTTIPASTTPGTSITSTPTSTASPSAGSLGKTAWSNNCASCHGGQISKGQSASKIMSAISNNTGGMGFLSGSISANDANNIATYAANPGAY